MVNVLSLCTGYGGLDMAVEEHFGATTRWVSDIDKNASVVAAHRFPHAPNLGNLKQIDWDLLAGSVDIVTAGYPCQPFSQAGRRRGVDDERHIWPDILRGIRILGPRIVVLENVRGHLRLGFDRVLGDLADSGFNARWAVVRASDAGAPHRRERIFVVASNANGAGSGRVASSDSAEGSLEVEPWGHTDRLGLAFADTDGVAAGRHAGTVPGPQGEGRGVRRLVGPADGVRGVATDADEPGEVERSGRRDCVDGRTDWGRFTAAVERWEAIVGRRAPAPLAAGTKVLNAEFTEWMMGLPKSWVTGVLGNRPALAVLGNGVVPQQAKFALEMLA